ncbi:MAG: ATP-binding protein [Lachnospiraceae bacterium]|nr:ATP-binding protein [Lachnospiraceae bacterium]
MENKKTIEIKLSGRIDSGNSAQKEEEILSLLAGQEGAAVRIDASELDYISSAGLRVLLRVRKAFPELSIEDVSSEVYEIFEMTGFTEMMAVKKAYRVVSVEGCEVIGEGFNGKVYRIDRDNVVKTYKNADALAEIQHEREVARLALVLGVPTAISYDVVRVGDSYGSVFELLNATSFARILAKEPERFDWCVDEYVKLLKKIHSISVPEGKLPAIKQKNVGAVKNIIGLLPDGLGEKLLAMVEAIPDTDNMIHGDYHSKNVVLADGEVLLIDMDTLSVGHPIFELVSMYNAYVGYSEYDPSIVLAFQGFDADVARRFWHDSLAAYLGTKDEKKINEIEEKVRCLAYGRLIDWRTRHQSGDAEADKATIDLWKSRLIELLGHVDSLDFETCCSAEESSDLELEAAPENLQKVLDFVGSRMAALDLSTKLRMQMDLAVEEIFINIANYAYHPGRGNAVVRVETTEDPVTVTITFIDRGIPYDPLKKQDPDLTLSAEERGIGGLGIFLTKKVMDDVSYEYRDGQNILKLKKNF